MTSDFFSNGNVPFVYDGRDRLILPESYFPGNDVVIIGRGKLVLNHPANIRFRALINSQLDAYSSAETKGLKSNILRRILNNVRNNSTNRLGFVKRDPDTGRWCTVNDDNARINIAQAFRDGLSAEYKSSKKRKQQKRNEELGISASSSSSCEDADEEARLLQQSIMSSMKQSENNVGDHAQRPAKRFCHATNQRARVTEEQPSDQTMGHLGSTMDRLRNLLDGASHVSQSNALSTTLQKRLKVESCDTFSRLCEKFGNDANTNNYSGDPFEPLPIALGNNNIPWSFPNTVEMAFPAFAMSRMVDKTNPGTTADQIQQHTRQTRLINPSTLADQIQQHTKQNRFVGLESRNPLNESGSRKGMQDEEDIIPATALTPLEFSDSDSTIGLKSLSSMSDFTEHCEADLHDAFELFGSCRPEDLEAVFLRN